MPRFEPHPARRPAIIAGASSGIGAATAIALSGCGHPVTLGARRLQVCQELAAKISAAGGETFACPLDVSESDSVRACVQAATQALGPPEILIATAVDLDAGL